MPIDDKESDYYTYSNYTHIEEISKKLINYIVENYPDATQKANKNKTPILADSHSMRGRGLTQARNVHEHLTNNFFKTADFPYVRKNTYHIGALLVHANPNDNTIKEMLDLLADDDNGWIRNSFCNPRDTLFTTSPYNYVKNEESGGRVFKLNALLEAIERKQKGFSEDKFGAGADKYDDKFLENYLNSFAYAIQNPYVPERDYLFSIALVALDVALFVTVLLAVAAFIASIVLLNVPLAIVGAAAVVTCCGLRFFQSRNEEKMNKWERINFDELDKNSPSP